MQLPRHSVSEGMLEQCRRGLTAYHEQCVRVTALDVNLRLLLHGTKQHVTRCTCIKHIMQMQLYVTPGGHQLYRLFIQSNVGAQPSNARKSGREEGASGVPGSLMVSIPRHC